MKGPRDGREGEAMVLAALVRLGYRVMIPFGEGHPYDLAIDLSGSQIMRVQCKTAWPVGGCMIFNCRSTDHGQGPGSYRGRADIFGVYFPPLQSVYLVPLNAVAEFEGRLRIEPPRNNQRRRVRFAADFEIQRWSLDSLSDVINGDAARNEPLAIVA